MPLLPSFATNAFGSCAANAGGLAETMRVKASKPAANGEPRQDIIAVVAIVASQAWSTERLLVDQNRSLAAVCIPIMSRPGVVGIVGVEPQARGAMSTRLAPIANFVTRTRCSRVKRLAGA